MRLPSRSKLARPALGLSLGRTLVGAEAVGILVDPNGNPAGRTVLQHARVQSMMWVVRSPLAKRGNRVNDDAAHRRERR